MPSYPTPKVHRRSRRKLGRGQYPAIPAALPTVTAAASTVTVTYDPPVIVSGPVGLAVDTPRGLVVPVLRNCDTLTIPQIAQAVTDTAEKAKNSQYGIEDLRGGTFTISNLGAIGGTYSTPIINWPEVAILLVGRSRKMPVVPAMV